MRPPTRNIRREMTKQATASTVSSSAKADDPVRRNVSIQSLMPVITGCPAGACHRARRRRDPVAGHDKSLRGPAAVDRIVGAGDLGGVVAAQKQRESCDLLGSHELLGRLRLKQHVLDDLLLG